MRLALLLLLSAAVRSPAEDPAPAPTTTTPEPAAQELRGDQDHDGVLSRKEARQLRRADRRARRRAQGLPDLPEDADEDEAASAESSARSAAAGKNAASAASAMKNSMASLDGAGAMPGGVGGGPGGAGGPAAAAGGAGGHAGGAAAQHGGDNTLSSGGMAGGARTAFTAGASGDPARPKSPSDFVLAARSGYEPAFAKNGLKLAPDGRTVVRLDGSPATAEDYANLRRDIGAMPGAVGRRPDFFEAISPGHYADVRKGYKEGAAKDTVYKDVAESEDKRDLVYDKSCPNTKLESGCNQTVGAASYKKGDYVAPEDLDKMWEALQKELDGAAASEDGKSPGDGMSLGGSAGRLARDGALGAAAELAGELVADNGPAGKGGGAVSGGGGGAATPAAGAALAVKKLWKTVAMGMPGSDGKAQSGTGLIILIAAVAALVLGAGYFLSRRGE